MRATGRELLDDPVESRSVLAGAFADIEAANRYLGGTAAAARMLDAWGARTVLDVGTGSADIPRALAAAARRRGRTLAITCVDTSEAVLALARERARDRALSFVRADGTRLPYGDGAFDVAMCNLTLHHLDPQPAVRFLRELRRVSSISPLVNDLRRSFGTWLGAWCWSRLCSRNPMTRHDAPLSARRAYTPAEALELARAAGWRNPAVRRARWCRMVLFDA